MDQRLVLLLPSSSGSRANRTSLAKGYLSCDETSWRWALSPAYDLNPSVFTVPASLTWLGRLEVPTKFETIERLAEIGGVGRGRAREVFDEVEAAVGEWGDDSDGRAAVAA